MVPYTAFHIFMQHDYRALLYFQPCICGQLFYCFRVYYLYYFESSLADILIPNPPYVLSVESYSGQLLIGPGYNLLINFLLSKLHILLLLRCLTTGPPLSK